MSSTTCEVLGTASVSGTNTLFGNQWNGTTLTATTAAAPTVTSSAPNLSASGMDCVSASWCVAVGFGGTLNNAATSFGELWNGTAWVVQTMPQPPGAVGSQLSSVSCAGVTFCQAVGQVNSAGPLSQNMVESWNGTQWAITASVPDTSATESQALTGVDCFSATTCSAVGFADAASAPSPASLALSWNGTAWSIVPSTPNGVVQTNVAAVSCVTDWSCVAVGNDRPTVGSFTAFAMSAPIFRTGYRFVASDGGVFSYGAGAPFLGSMGGTPLNKPIVGMAVMPGGDGYDLVASDGGVFSFGSAQFYGSTGSMKLNAPIVGMALTADGAGYWLVASDGGIFSYGDAQFYGSTGSLHLNKPIVGMAATPDGKGYYLVASDGGIFNYGDALVPGLGRLAAPQPARGRHGRPGFGRLLPGRHRRRHLHLPDHRRSALLRLHGIDQAQQADRGDDRRVERLLPERFGRRGLHLSDHERPDVLRLHGLHRAQQAHRGDLRIRGSGLHRRPAYRVIADTAVSNRVPGTPWHAAGGPTLPKV